MAFFRSIFEQRPDFPAHLARPGSPIAQAGQPVISRNEVQGDALLRLALVMVAELVEKAGIVDRG
jgi:hypothetical protein